MPDEGDRIVRYDEVKKAYVNNNGEYLKFSPKSIGIYDKDPAEPHAGVHINDKKDGTYDINVHGENEKVTNMGNCYLTTACLYHLRENFDDNCEELTILRWFRDNFVKGDDVAHYYKTAPIIVKAIDCYDDCEEIYLKLYNSVILPCVTAIKNHDYTFAYQTYMRCVGILEEIYARPVLEDRLIKSLRLIQERNE